MAAGAVWLITGGGLGVVLLVLCITRLVREPYKCRLPRTAALSAIGAGLAVLGLLGVLSTPCRWAGWQTGLAVSATEALLGAVLLRGAARKPTDAPRKSWLGGVPQEFTLVAVESAVLPAIALQVQPRALDPRTAWIGGTASWIGHMFLLVLAVLAVLTLAWLVTHLVPEPHRSRLVGLLTVLTVVVAVGLVVWLLLRSARAPSYVHDHEWTTAHAVAAVLTVVALIALARQWPALVLRIVAFSLVVLWSAVAFEVGRGALYRASLRAEHAAVTQLDRQLYQAKPLKDEAARKKAQSAQRAIADACTRAGGVLRSEDFMTDRAEKTYQPSYNSRDTCGELNPLTEVDDARAKAEAAVRPLLATANVDQRRATSMGAERDRLTELDKQLSEAKSINRDDAHRESAQNAEVAIGDACTQAGGVLRSTAPAKDGGAQPDHPSYDKTDTCQEAPAPNPAPNYQVVATRTKAAETVAEVQAAVGKTGADKQLADAEAARAAAESANADTLTAQAGAPVEAVAASGRELLASATRTHPDSTASVGAVGWALFVLAAVYFYRRLEISNAGLLPGPVTVEVEGGGTKKSPSATSTDKTSTPEGKTPTASSAETAAADITAVLRHHLLKNVPEPSVIPGGQALQSVTDLVGLDAVHGKVLNAALAVLHTLGFPRRGYVVRATITQPGATAAADSGVAASGAEAPAGVGANDRYEICVRILCARTGETMHTCTTRDDTVEDALAEAGYDVTVWIINRARAVPPWLRWEPNAAKAFLRFERLSKGAGQPRTYQQIDTLKDVVREAPQCGAALVLLAEALDLARRHVEAVEYYDRACALFPDYAIARYRRARGVDIVAEGFGDRPDTDKALIWRVVDVGHAAATSDPDEQSYILHRWALKETRRAGRLALWLPYRKLSVRERTGSWPLKQWPSIVAIWWSSTGPTVVRCNKHFGALGIMEWIAKRRGMDCTVSYNLACYETTLSKHHWWLSCPNKGDQAAHRKAAIEHLQRCLKRPHLSLLSTKWLSIDPDLAPLCDDPATRDEFNDVIQNMRQ